MSETCSPKTNLEHPTGLEEAALAAANTKARPVDLEPR
jgi:hypothetical protein